MVGGDYPATFERTYDCARDCGGKRSRERRRGRGCTRVDLPLVPWDVDARELYQRPSVNHSDGDGVHWRGTGLYFGRWPDRTLDGRDELGIRYDWEEPIEPAEDGCPAGWARSPFVDSVTRYARHRTETGNRVENPFFNQASWQAQEAAMYLETEQERWAANRQQIDAQRWRAKQAREGGKHGAR